MKTVIHNVTTGEISEIEWTPEQIEFEESERNKLAWSMLRSTRDKLLADCDWTVLSDTPTSTAAWKTYRQELRDLPANTTDPFNPVWPTPPA